MASVSVHIPWYATGFRGDKLEAALAEISPVALKYGATHHSVYRSNDDRYKFVQIADFTSKDDWTRYWESPEFIRFRTLSSGWFQVPVIYSMQSLIVEGELKAAANGHKAEAAA